MSESVTSSEQSSEKLTNLAQNHLSTSVSGQLQEQIERQKALARVISRIRTSLELDTIFKTTATEVRWLLNADRVGVFRFDPDSRWDDGEFVSEDVLSPFPSALATKIHDHCFGEQFAVHYAQGRVQSVADIYCAGLSDCHIKILEAFQVRANLIVPLLKGENLWGLICIHQCSEAREWQPSEIEFVKQVADHFGIALQQVEYIEKIKLQANLLVQAKAQEKALICQQALVKIANTIRQSLDFTTICQTTTAEVRQLLEVDRVTIYRFNPDWSGDILFESLGEGWKPLVGVSPTIEDTHLMETQGGRYAGNETFAIPDIYKAGHTDCHVALLEEFQARAYIVAPIFQEQRLWGLLTAFQNSSPRFWESDEVQLLAQIGEQLGIALQQSEIVAQIQAQTTELDRMLQELQESQMQLIQNEKMASLGQLVAGIAHEINNPINFIYGNLDYINEYVQKVVSLIYLYQEYYPHPAVEIQKKSEEIDLDFILKDSQKILASLKFGAERIRKIVLSLRNFSRLDEAECKPVAIHEGIESTLLILGHRLQPAGNQRGIEVITNYGNVPLIECYPAQLNQVFMNLLTNAIASLEKAIAGGKFKDSNILEKQPARIWINTRLINQNQVEIRIRDNGVGISESTKAKIFDRFFSSMGSQQRTGLGLVNTLQIIAEKHHGTIKVNSTPDQGAEFIIYLPVKMKA
ncbi:MAG TPA: GAF domain-containing protein [Kamptonema sp.]|nr:GAF domain-containing protein [Kamptonema sp.]